MKFLLHLVPCHSSSYPGLPCLCLNSLHFPECNTYIYICFCHVYYVHNQATDLRIDTLCPPKAAGMVGQYGVSGIRWSGEQWLRGVSTCLLYVLPKAYKKKCSTLFWGNCLIYKYLFERFFKSSICFLAAFSTVQSSVGVFPPDTWPSRFGDHLTAFSFQTPWLIHCIDLPVSLLCFCVSKTSICYETLPYCILIVPVYCLICSLCFWTVPVIDGYAPSGDFSASAQLVVFCMNDLHLVPDAPLLPFPTPVIC